MINLEARTYTVKVVPNSRREGVEAHPSGVLKVRVNQPPEDGRANAAAIELLARYFHVRKSCIEIVRGHTSRLKQVRISQQHRKEPKNAESERTN
jgi:uncharacterized protein (TIGR00251 family)